MVSKVSLDEQRMLITSCLDFSVNNHTQGNHLFNSATKKLADIAYAIFTTIWNEESAASKQTNPQTQSSLTDGCKRAEAIYKFFESERIGLKAVRALKDIYILFYQNKNEEGMKLFDAFKSEYPTIAKAIFFHAWKKANNADNEKTFVEWGQERFNSNDGCSQKAQMIYDFINERGHTILERPTPVAETTTKTHYLTKEEFLSLPEEDRQKYAPTTAPMKQTANSLQTIVWEEWNHFTKLSFMGKVLHLQEIYHKFKSCHEVIATCHEALTIVPEIYHVVKPVLSSTLVVLK